jgi:hypothetical protein
MPATDEKIEATEKDRIAALEAELAAAKAEAARYRPFVDVSNRMFSTVQDVRDYYGERKIRDIAGDELANINKTRLRQGLDRITYSDAEWEQAIDEKAQEILGDRTRWVKTDGGARRTLKMVRPDGSLTQIPVEDQINNQAGSLNDGVGRYKDKGFKLATVDGAILCAMEDCWEPSAVENGQPVYAGYCSAQHRGMVEPRKVGQVDNVITAAQVRV